MRIRSFVVQAPAESEGGAPPVSFDSVMSATFTGLTEGVPDGPPPIPAESPAPAPAAEPPTPAPAPAAPDQTQQVLLQALAAAIGSNTQMAQLLQQQRQAQAPAAPPPEEAGVPSVEKVMDSFVSPRRQPGEDDASYAARNDRAAMDHLNRTLGDYHRDVASKAAQAAVAQYRAEVQAMQQAESGERQLTGAIEKAVTAAGFAAGTPATGFVAQQIRANLDAMSARGETRGFQSRRDWDNKIAELASTYKAHLAPAPPVPAGAPALALVPKAAAPISSGGRTGAAPLPANGASPKPRTFDEGMSQIWNAVSKG